MLKLFYLDERERKKGVFAIEDLRSTETMIRVDAIQLYSVTAHTSPADAENPERAYFDYF